MIIRVPLAISLLTIGVFAASPSSTNFTLKSYDVGGGGGGATSSSNYKLNGQLGGQSGDPASSSNYILGGGKTPTENANIPPAPTLTNPGNSEYLRLKLVINTGSNPSDTLFAIAISSDNFATTNYVKADNSMSTSLAITDYQTYAAWGGASGFYITGLLPSTTYKVKVKAMQGGFTETTYGPATSGVATVLPSLTFGVSTSPPTGPPYTASFSSLVSGTVFTASNDVILSLTTNSLVGGSVYVQDTNNGLTSTSQSHTITSATADLGTAASGYGGMVTATSQSSGGPLTAAAPYNGVSDNVGALNTLLQAICSSTGAVDTGSITFKIKAKAEASTPSANDYSDTITFVASMNF